MTIEKFEICAIGSPCKAGPRLRTAISTLTPIYNLFEFVNRAPLPSRRPWSVLDETRKRRNGEPTESESRARRQRTADAQIPLPGGTRRKDSAADTGDAGPSRLAQGDADAGLQRGQYARGGYGQALSAVRRRHD